MHRGLRAALAVTLVGSACSSGQILAVGPQRPEQHANWERCPSSVIDQIGDEVDVECAAVEVPVSYSDAETPTITIQMARVSATGSASNKKGVLFVNPGGPGGSGVDFLAQVDELPDSVRSHYDIIGFDPRGLGYSTSLDCLTTAERRELNDQPTPHDPVASEELSRVWASRVAEGCRRDDELLLNHMSTFEVAHDLDIMRAAVGEEQLNFLGLSYGTRIGAMYAKLYPHRVGRMVLDSPVLPTSDRYTLSTQQLDAVGTQLNNLLKRCVENCPLGADPVGTTEAVLDALDQQQAPPITGDDLRTAMVVALYEPALGQLVWAIIAAIRDGNATRISLAKTIVDDLNSTLNNERTDGTYGNGKEVQLIVNCADSAAPLSPEQVTRLNETATGHAPLLTNSQVRLSEECNVLPTSDGNDELGPSAAADRILVMASTDDAATPYTWMQPFASTLGATHRFTYRGPGHANSLSAECAKAAMESYFETGDTSQTSCELDPASLDLRQAFVEGASESVGTGLTPSARECFADALATVDILEMYSAATSSEAKDDLAERVSEALLACLRPS